MPRFMATHIREQGIDLIVIPLKSSFHRKSEKEQTDFIDELQMRANAAGLAGTVVPVWKVGNRMGFIAPQPWPPFFKSIAWNVILTNLSKEIFW